jgi:N-acetylglucosamine kinase-like BadF-type ATPase
MMKVVIGIDGGATKTEASLVAFDTKQVLGTAQSGPSNMNSVGTEVTRDNLLKAMLGSFENTNQQQQQQQYELVGVAFGMSGVDRPHDKELVRSWVPSLLESISTQFQTVSVQENPSVLIYNDAVSAMSSGTLGVLKDSLVIISGTGMIVTGSADGTNFVRTGGWGPLLGDEGSGYAIGSAVLRAVVNDKDGLSDEPTVLVDLVKQQLNIQDASLLIDFVYKNTSWDRIADLARLAFKGYELNDNISKRIINDAVEHLSRYIIACAKKLEWNFETKAFTLVYTGSILCHKDSVIAQLLTARLKQIFAKITVVFPQVPASVGSALLLIH